MRTLGSPLLALLMQAQGGRCMSDCVCTRQFLHSSPDDGPVGENRSARPGAAVDRFVGHHSLQVVDVPPRRPASRAQFSRRLPPQQQVFRSAGRLPLAGRQPARRPVPVRLRRADRPAAQHAPAGPSPTRPRPNPPAAPRPTLKSLAAVDRALLRASVVEINKLEHWVSFLATTASIAPFIGLFGTVVGHHERVSQRSARRGIDESGSGCDRASRKRSSPPRRASSPRFRRCMFYNYLSQRVKSSPSAMDDFSMEFLNIAERNFT